MFEPWNSDGSNRFDLFLSHRTAADGQRPVLGLVFNQPAGMPNFKLPIPGNARWILTGEAGGYECLGESPLPDTAHQGNNYFSLDFNSDGVLDSGGSYGSTVPILAAAGGTVVALETNSNNVNANGGQGWYITLDHGSGYLTRYLHFSDRAKRASGTLLNVGDWVNQGDQIGKMGKTGDPSYGIHLHINFWYKDPQTNQVSGASTVQLLTYVIMEGLLIKSYQTECHVNSAGVPTDRFRRYHSSNIPTLR